MKIKTYQDLLNVKNSEIEKQEFVFEVIAQHKLSSDYNTAMIAEDYVKGRNRTIQDYQKLLYTVTGATVPDTYSPNHKCKSAFFKRFVTQEATFLLGNGVKFSGNEIEVPAGTDGASERVERVSVKGDEVVFEKRWFLNVDSGTKRKLGKNFDQQLYFIAKSALIQKVCFGFWNYDHLEMFKLTEFAPLYDEENGALMAGVRWWQIDAHKPLRATLYEPDGYTEYKKDNGKITVLQEKRPYILTTRSSKADGVTIFDGKNYPSFPIVPLWGNPERQSEIEGIREQIDCYDLIKNGFANDLDEASIIYWAVSNAGGMDDIDLAEFKQRLRTTHIALADRDGASVTAHTLDVPSEGREACLSRLEKDLYRDFMALDVEAISAGNVTATQIDAAYEPVNEKADEFEFCVIDFIQGILSIIGIEDNPTFTRSKISNQSEYVTMILQCGEYLDDETILELLPFITPEMKEIVKQRRIGEESARFQLVDNEGLTDND